jgi:hypothetical protein
MKLTDAWAKFTTAELKAKLEALQELIEGGTLTDRSLDHQFTEIAFIERELASRDGE